jgi:hypothetical protein
MAHHHPERASRGLTRSPAHPAGTEHPWTGWTFSAGWDTRQKLDPVLVEPGMVVEVGIDVARDAGGRWRHPARFHRPRVDLSPTDVLQSG